MNNRLAYRKGTTKKCPRCGEVCLNNQVKCPDCGLIFARLQYVTNTEGKKALKAGEKERVIYITQPTYDISKIKALLLCIFLGIFGVHNYYLGRYKRGIYVTFCFLYTVFILILNESVYYGTWWYELLFYSFAPFGACILFFWVMDIINITFEKYKFPVALPKPDYETMKESLELDKVNEDVEKLTSNKEKKSTKKSSNKKTDKVVTLKPKQDSLEEKKEQRTEKKKEVFDSVENKEEKLEDKTESSSDKKIVSIKNKKYGSYNNTKNKKKSK